MPPCNWPQNSVSVTEFALWRSPRSSALMWLTERRGGVSRLLCFGSGLGKLLRQLLCVACNAFSSYPTANSLPPPSRPQRGWKKEKLLLVLTILAHVSLEIVSFSILCPLTVWIRGHRRGITYPMLSQVFPTLWQYSFSNSKRLQVSERK